MCVFFQYISAYRHRDRHVVTQVRANANSEQFLGQVWSVIFDSGKKFVQPTEYILFLCLQTIDSLHLRAGFDQQKLKHFKSQRSKT